MTSNIKSHEYLNLPLPLLSYLSCQHFLALKCMLSANRKTYLFLSSFLIHFNYYAITLSYFDICCKTPVFYTAALSMCLNSKASFSVFPDAHYLSECNSHSTMFVYRELCASVCPTYQPLQQVTRAHRSACLLYCCPDSHCRICLTRNHLQER